MFEYGIGLTKLYGKFNDPDDPSENIAELRALHQALDEDVLKSFGWNDIHLEYDFSLDYESDETEESSRKRKLPWRYKIKQEINDEILMRLLSLNQCRYDEEVRLGLTKR